MDKWILIIVLSFSTWMLVDAWRRKVPYYWFLIIFFAPLGALIYFVFMKLNVSTDGHAPVGNRKNSVDAMREEFERSATVQNRLNLARALAESGNHDAALKEFQAVLVTHPSDKDALFGAGQSAFSRGDFKAAVDYLNPIVAAHPSFAAYAAWQLLGEAFWCDGDQQKATEVVAKLCKISHRIDHQLILARCYLEQDRKTEARAILEEAVADYNLANSEIQKQSRNELKQVQRLLQRLS